MMTKCPICRQPMLKFVKVLAVHLFEKHSYTKDDAEKRAKEVIKSENG